jgi:hypothetical protein
MKNNPRLVSLSLVFAAALFGCGAPAPMALQCETDAECGPGAACAPGGGQCLPVASFTPTLEVLPPSGTQLSWVAQEVIEPQIDAGGRLQVQLDPAVSITGKVVTSDAPETPIPARITAIRPSLLEGRPKMKLETESADPRFAGDSGYVLWVNAGQTYTFKVTPLPPHDAQYPPLVVPDLRVEDHMKRTFVLDGQDRAVQVVGRILDYQGAPLAPNLVSDQDQNKLSSSVRVKAYEPGGLRRSTESTTDPETGDFSFRIPAGVAPYDLKIQSAAGSMPVPTVVCQGATLGLSPYRTELPPMQNLGDIRLPSFLLPRLYSVKVVTVVDGERKPVMGATVVFRSEVDVMPPNSGFDSCTAVYEQSGLTDQEGLVQLLLIPGSATRNRTYSVAVKSPASSRAASRWIEQMEVGPKNDDKPVHLPSIELDRRYRLAGSVINQMDGAPVRNVKIEAKRVGGGVAASQVPESNAQATSGDEGQFELYVDPGIYNLELTPPEGSGLPAFGMTRRLDSALDGALFEIPIPKMLLGQVVDPSGAPAHVAKLQVYEIVPEQEKPVTLGASLRASTVTDEQGNFKLILADRPIQTASDL